MYLRILLKRGRYTADVPRVKPGEYEAEVLDEEIVVRCLKCHAAAVVPANSFTAANDFLNADHLTLE